jgi:hypothetical protein
MTRPIIWNVTFPVKVQSAKQGRFSIPKPICDALDLANSIFFKAVVTNGETSVVCELTLVSGNEIVANKESPLYEIATPAAALIVTILHVQTN